MAQTSGAGVATAEMMGSEGREFFGHPRGLSVLFFTEMWERFSFYGMRALLILFMVAPIDKGGMGLDTVFAASIYGWYTMGVYLTAIPGGWIADRFLGLRYSILLGGILIALGHFSLVFHHVETFFAGLILIVLGTGLLKPNISTLVGKLYKPQDVRRDSGFYIFYMGINIGSMIAPLVCGYLAQKWNGGNWHYGFAAAGVGMTLGLAQFVVGWKWLGNIGLKPATQAANTQKISHSFSMEEWKRIGAIFIFFVFATIFWAAFEQAGSSLNLFADKVTSNVLLGWSFASSYYQAINGLFIILLAPLMAWFWIRLGKRNPSSPMKFTMGLVFVGLGFLVMRMAAQNSHDGTVLVSPMWLVVCYLLHSIGELCLSPVFLSIVTKLAPASVAGMMMGVSFLALSFGNKLGGWIAGFFEILPLPKLFGAVFLTTTAAAVCLLLLVKPIRKLMGGVH